MTPLTHAAVGIAIYQKLRPRRIRHFGWAVAFALAFGSHYLLDAIPHFEDTGSFSNYRQSVVVFLGLGAIGTSLSLLLMRRNREAGLIWLILSLWIGLGSYSYPQWRILTAILGLSYLAWKSKQPDALGYVLAGMLAVSADLISLPFYSAEGLHHAMHYEVDWGSRLYLHFSQDSIPGDWYVRLQDPYFLAGYGLELLVEGAIFFGALYLFSRQPFAWGNHAPQESEGREPAEAPGRGHAG